MFKAALKKIVEPTDGCVAGIIMGFDGIRVDHVLKEESSIDIRDVGAELSVILMNVKRAAQELEAGDAEEVVVRADDLVTLARIVDAEYFIAITLTPGANVGKARYLCRGVALEVKALLE